MDDDDHNAMIATDGVESNLQPLSIPQAWYDLWFVVCGLCLYGGSKAWDDVTRCSEFEAVMHWWCYGDSDDNEVRSGLAVTVWL